jgi:hypothetical protein
MTRLLAASALAAVAVALAPIPIGAQEVRGVAVDAEGRALPGVVVALHRVGDTGGDNVASVTTDVEGRFHFQVETRDDAIYFAAMRIDGRMYIGPPAMAGAERVSGYVLAADPDAEAGALASMMAQEGAGTGGFGAQPGSATRGGTGTGGAGGGADAGLLFAGILALLSAGVFMVAAPRYRRRRTRDALYELATVEEALAGEPEAADRPELLRRRAELRGRLAPRS